MLARSFEDRDGVLQIDHRKMGKIMGGYCATDQKCSENYKRDTLSKRGETTHNGK